MPSEANENNNDIEVIYKLLQENNSKINTYCEELSSIDKSIRELVRSNKNYSYNKEQILQLLNDEYKKFHNNLYSMNRINNKFYNQQNLLIIIIN